MATEISDSLNILTFETEVTEAFSHTVAYSCSSSLLYPDAKLAIDTAIEDGFYYDFDVEVPFTQDLGKSSRDEKS